MVAELDLRTSLDELLAEREMMREQLRDIANFVSRLREEPTIRSIEAGQFGLQAPLRFNAPGAEYGVVRDENGHLVTVPIGDAQEEWSDATGGPLAPSNAKYLVAEDHAQLSADIAVGLTPGGELGGTWPAPTVDAVHSGTSHAGVVATHEAASDPHTGYVREADANWIDLTDGGASALHSHAGGSGDLKADGTVPLTANWDAGSFEIRAQTLESDVATGTPPLTIASTTKVDNLNADLLDGLSSAAFQSSTADFSKFDPDAKPSSPSALDDEMDTISAGLPASGLWTEIDHGAHMTVSVDARGAALVQATHAGNSNSGLVQAIPAGDFDIWCKLHIAGAHRVTYTQAGLFLLEGTASTNDHYLWYFYDTGSPAIYLQRWADYANFTSTTAGPLAFDASGNVFYMRVARTGTTYYFYYSQDGISWKLGHSGTLAFAPTHFGPFMGQAASGQTMVLVVQWFRYLSVHNGLTAVLPGRRIKGWAA